LKLSNPIGTFFRQKDSVSRAKLNVHGYTGNLPFEMQLCPPERKTFPEICANLSLKTVPRCSHLN
jgi:hypothetical protein